MQSPKDIRRHQLASEIIRAHGDLLHKRITEADYYQKSKKVMDDAHPMFTPLEIQQYAMSNQDAIVAELERTNPGVSFNPNDLFDGTGRLKS